MKIWDIDSRRDMIVLTKTERKEMKKYIVLFPSSIVKLCYKSTKIQAEARDIKIGNTTPKCAAVSANFGLVVTVSVVTHNLQFC